jgi:hypothetical protein
MTNDKVCQQREIQILEIYALVHYIDWHLQNEDTEHNTKTLNAAAFF